ncbi:MAG: C4-dicarboxylate TRAP transporter substrate-binding protein [Gammaproteobacteria bacterium]|nr:C4-dicarboxylate TRAP transporter substrate-binding protein [Gammaproteobacteria bacterium]
MTRLTKLALAAIFAANTFAAAPLAAKDFTFAIGLPPIHTWSKHFTYVDENIEARSNGALSSEVFYGSLLNLKQSLTGLRDGIADSALVVPGYHPAELPQTNLIVDLAMLGQNAIVLSAAVSEYMFSCAECLAESEANGSVFVAMTANAPYMLQTTEPMITLDSLKGKKIRSFSAFGRWVEYMGGIKMSLSANDIYDALSRGTLDANLHPATELYNLNFKDVAKYITRLPLGTYNGNQFNFNTKTWRGLTTEQRRLLLDMYAEGAALTTVQFQTFNDEILNTKAAADGIKVLEPSPELVAATQKFIAEDMANMDAMAKKNYSINDAPARIERFRGLVEKWRGLLKTIDTSDVAAVTALYKKEIWDKVNAATHGM